MKKYLLILPIVLLSCRDDQQMKCYTIKAKNRSGSDINYICSDRDPELGEIIQITYQDCEACYDNYLKR